MNIRGKGVQYEDRESRIITAVSSILLFIKHIRCKTRHVQKTFVYLSFLGSPLESSNDLVVLCQEGS